MTGQTRTPSLLAARPVLPGATWSARASVGQAIPFSLVSAPVGRRTVKIEPLPASLATVTSPPIMRATLRVMASPQSGAPKPLGGGGLGLAELLEQLQLLLRRHADAGI